VLEPGASLRRCEAALIIHPASGSVKTWKSTRVYRVDDARELLSREGIDVEATNRREVHERLHPRPKTRRTVVENR
jgi:hypothetical protein